MNENYTWRNHTDPFNPAALDRIIYSDSVLGVENAFVLNTMLLSDEALAALGLRVDDVVLDARSGYYDQLPIVAHFVIANSPRAVSLNAGGEQCPPSSELPAAHRSSRMRA